MEPLFNTTLKIKQKWPLGGVLGEETIYMEVLKEIVQKKKKGSKKKGWSDTSGVAPGQN